VARAIAVVGAPSSIGIRPYDDGAVRQLNRAPSVLRERGLIARLGAADLGDVAPPLYRDYERAPGRVRNEAELALYLRALASRVSAAIGEGRFGVVLGGDCSIVLACLLAARQKAGDPIGLVYADAHADFASPHSSRSGSAASMALALATGRGDSPLARLGRHQPLVADRQVALIGRRDAADVWPGHADLAASAILDVPSAGIRGDDWLEVAETTLERVAAEEVGGFWIQVDADVLNPSAMPAVDSPEPGGPSPSELLHFLAPLVRHPRALGLSLTIYDPALDPDRAGARQLVHILESLLAPVPSHSRLHQLQ
jgi:arginase